jgi:hypothetical protein
MQQYKYINQIDHIKSRCILFAYSRLHRPKEEVQQWEADPANHALSPFEWRMDTTPVSARVADDARQLLRTQERDVYSSLADGEQNRNRQNHLVVDT